MRPRSSRVDLAPGEAWLLLRAHEGLHDPAAIAADWSIDADRIREGRARLGERGLLAGDELTGPGRATTERLIDARQDGLRSLVADWRQDDDSRVNDVVERLARELPRDVPAS